MRENTFSSLTLKRYIINSLLLALGFILKDIVPPLLFGMRPDLMLAIMLIIIVTNKDYKTTLITGILCGIITSVSTTFPGGQIPNIIDKIITSHVIYFILLPIISKLNNQIQTIVCSAIGTLVSGFIFLLSASILVGLPGSASLSALFVTVVIPSTAVNTLASIVIFNAIKVSSKHSSVNLFSN